MKNKKLNELEVGKTGKIIKIGGQGATRQHLLDMGLIPDAVIKLVKFAPSILNEKYNFKDKNYIICKKEVGDLHE